MEVTQLKRCSKCGRELPITEFYYLKSRNTYTTWCKDCYSERTKTPEYKQKQKERRIKQALGLSERHQEERTQYQQVERNKNIEEMVQSCISSSPASPVKDLMSIEDCVSLLKKDRNFKLEEYFTPRELINALYQLGYRGELSIMVEKKIKLSYE